MHPLDIVQSGWDRAVLASRNVLRDHNKGDELRRFATAQMNERGVRDPDRMAALIVPGVRAN